MIISPFLFFFFAENLKIREQMLFLEVFLTPKMSYFMLSFGYTIIPDLYIWSLVNVCVSI